MKRLMAMLAVAIPMVAAAEKVELEGRGGLAARGSGKAEIEGRLNFHGRAGQAVLVIEDRAGDAEIRVVGYGRRIDEGNGKVRYVGFNGRVHVQGSDVAIQLRGRDIQFVVWGAGKATLNGHGRYRTFHDVGAWSEEDTQLDFDDEAGVAEAE